MRIRNLKRSVAKGNGTFVSATDRLIAQKLEELAKKKKEEQEQAAQIQPVAP